jgi:CRP/FNR family transcriptional activator FtrB
LAKGRGPVALEVLPEDIEDGSLSTARAALGVAPWLSGVPDEILDSLAEQSIFHRVPAGSLLFEQAETPGFAVFLAQGSVELLGVRGKDEALIEIVCAPDFLLLAAVLCRQPYLLRARIRDDARLAMIQADTFRRAVASNHALCLAVLACQAAQFRRQVKQAKNVRLRSAEERVGCYLLRLAMEAKPNEPVRLPLEKRLIASQLEMTRETFSRTLAAVARHGIRVDGDLVSIEDQDAALRRFRLDPLIDGIEIVSPLSSERNLP